MTLKVGINELKLKFVGTGFLNIKTTYSAEKIKIKIGRIAPKNPFMLLIF